jgi:hypothetical protein
MRQIFVFTAGNPEARQHLADSIQNHIEDEKLFAHFDEQHHAELHRIRDEAGGFYAWGAVWGIRNILLGSRWNATTSSCASTTASTTTSLGFSLSTTTPSAPRPSGASTKKDRPDATCTS